MWSKSLFDALIAAALDNIQTFASLPSAVVIR